MGHDHIWDTHMYQRLIQWTHRNLDICADRTDTNIESNIRAHLAVTLCQLTRGLPHSLRATVLA